jgi:hypothetical protein
LWAPVISRDSWKSNVTGVKNNKLHFEQIKYEVAMRCPGVNAKKEVVCMSVWRENLRWTWVASPHRWMLEPLGWIESHNMHTTLTYSQETTS